MKRTAVLGAVVVLAACQDTSSSEEGTSEVDAGEQNFSSTIEIEGVGHHYHTGDLIELTAHLDEEVDYDHWHWYVRQDETDEWETLPDQYSKDFEFEAPEETFELQAVLFDDEHEVFAESDVIEIAIDNHHGNDEVTRRIYNGFFYNDEVADRELSDFEGDWQSVYPYLLNGDLDEVMEEKAANSDSMTKEDYIDYYTIGYETDVERIVIEDDTFTFYYDDGREYTAPYEYDGYEVLTYERGNRGVRFIFERTDDTEEMPRYFQFSDHNINPTTSHHFHLYWGEDREELLEEVTNWPTYYPSNYTTEELVRDMLAH